VPKHMLEIKNLSFNYGQHPISFPDWKVMSNGQALILGNSGSGKTTLLHLISGLLKPSGGSISINGQSLDELSQKKLDRFRGENIGIVFQRPHLIKSLTVLENLELSVHLSGKRVEKNKYGQILESLNILEYKNRMIHQLSEGQAQRVSIARAVIHDPVLLAADEPTASLDDQNCERVLKLLKNQAQERNAMLIIATHDQRIKGEFSNQITL
jgi:putative ABC transport system ATP-binding protein